MADSPHSELVARIRSALGASGEQERRGCAALEELVEQFDTAVAALEHIGSPNYSARPTGRDALDMAGAARDALRRIRGEET